VKYKIVELGSVTDEEIEAAINEWVGPADPWGRPGRGWTFDGMHFALRESSKRPSMAFLSFTRPDDASGGRPD